jgi:hypothetical protein
MYTVCDGAQKLLAMMGMRCALFLFSYAVLEGRGDPCHDPGQPKQLNIAFPKLTASYVTRRDTEHCVWVNQLYSGAVKLPQR